jgi:predicted ATPase
VLAQAVADAVGLAQVAGDPGAALATALAHSPGLLVLDNCEHLVDGVATLAAELLERCPQLSILATSREPLGVDGEKTVPLDPLPGDAAVELLLDRITAIRPGWTPTAEEHRHARHVCAALDGLPLALELAAARARVLGLGEIAERLDDRFAVLGEVPRGSLTPHATLQAAIAWSIDLLPETDRALLTRLWPFEGGFSLAAAETVGGTGTPVLESLSALVSRSMIIADTTMTPARYRLLETIRAFCRAADPDEKATQDAHAQWIRELATARGADMLGERSGWATRILSREWPNLRAGLAHDLTWHPAAALRTVGRLDWFWHRSGHITESRQLIRAALAAAPDASEVDRAAALASLVILTYFAGDLDEARHLTHLANATITDEATASRMRFYTAMGGLITGDPRTARDAAVEAIAAGQRLGQPWLVVGGQMILGTALVVLDEVTTGETSLLEAAGLAQRCGMPWAVGWANFALAQSYLVRGAPAGDALRLALDRFDQDEDINYVLAVLFSGAHVLMREGRPADAGRLRAAVRQHANRLGLHPERLVMLDLSRLTPELPEYDGPLPDWREMIALFA